jgi:hypothetical protein
VPPLIVTVGVPQNAPTVATEIVMLSVSLPLDGLRTLEGWLMLFVDDEHGAVTVSVKLWVASEPTPLAALKVMG